MAELTDRQKIELIELVEGFLELWNMKAKCYRETKIKDKNTKWQISNSHSHFKTTGEFLKEKVKSENRFAFLQ